MFSIKQINDVHARLGSANTLPEYVRALKALNTSGLLRIQRFERNNSIQPLLL